MSGFAKIDNRIIEEMAKRKFNGTQYRILFAVWRNTYGWQRETHDLSLGFIAEATGIERSRVKKDLNKLIEFKVINVVQEASFNKSRVIAFNENFDEWLIDSCVPNRPQGANSTTGDEKDYTPGGEIDPTRGGESDPQQRKIKEISKEKDDDLLDKPNPIQEYEKHFGSFPGAMFIQTINHWIDNSQFQEPEAIICETIRRVKLQHPKNPPRYIDQTLSNLHNLELYTLAAVKEYNENYERKIKKQFSSSRSKSFKEMSSRPSGVQEPAPLTEQERQELEALKEDFPF
ncbi:replication protein [Bacillus sp. Hm123]|uniref:replication protein n=1 Tax=Bacillus sp. Hm123 TaxID=3450745 RepID=UPI003F433C18